MRAVFLQREELIISQRIDVLSRTHWRRKIKLQKRGGSALGTRRTYATPEGHLNCMQYLIIVRCADYCYMVNAANDMVAIKCMCCMEGSPGGMCAISS